MTTDDGLPVFDSSGDDALPPGAEGGCEFMTFRRRAASGRSRLRRDTSLVGANGPRHELMISAGISSFIKEEYDQIWCLTLVLIK
jgi:hypothetical protein